ncbi:MULTISPECIES: alpha/beta hydrolase [Kitasatospora]|uniref:Putative peptidase S33 family protein n=1 Tax=Kitasatospora setae (strain ATCC 33774 / DSM 43861 / JCM 3304 / KCC A-0304 / NBRC 14216 / KM-6054) TaxID=452652 RepID=E4NDU9_KITSK|nr:MULTISPECIES: alpha/beta hydrolase [Kitasatospora]BAJ29380.1 putative peptidase S33 family protein [Kitasatospora setae KM-6054]
MTVARTRRLLPAAALAAAVSLLLAGCTSGHPAASGTPSGTPGQSTDSVPGVPAAGATPLEPLPAEPAAALAPYYAQKLGWQACDSGFECATFKVPLDYAHPGDGREVELSAVRKPAGGTGHRIGSLLLNPGGPGGSAVDYVERVAARYDAGVRSSYDLVGFDPRGVGRSAPVTCLTGPRMDAYTATDLTPDDQREIDALVAADQEFAAGCRAEAGELLGHVSTVEAARDMDVLRALVGDRKLNYVGKSYGTFLGATYAGLFPGKVGKVVLDGAMDPSLDAATGNLTQAGGFETAWKAFAKDCAGRDDCPLGRSEQQAGTELTALFARLDAKPLPTDQNRPLTESLALTGVAQAMYAETLWSYLREALTTARAGDGSGLLKLSDSYYGRDRDGGYENLMYANMAVNCLDLPAPFADPAAVAAAVPAFEKAAPHFGRDMAWMALGCAYWPDKATGAPHTIRAAGSDPIVVVGTTRDPATPYAWAKSLAGQLEAGRLLTYEGDGHTAYQRQNACVDGAINGYLLGGEAPANGKVCKD